MRTVYLALFSISFVLSAHDGYAQDGGAETQSPSPNLGEGENPLRRIPDSLMFTTDELNDIQGRIASGRGGEDEERSAIEDASLYLATILYSGPASWTVWINDVPVSSGQELKSFEIRDIGPNFVELLVPLSAQGMRPVRLSPNQSFVTRSGAVVEGRWRD